MANPQRQIEPPAPTKTVVVERRLFQAGVAMDLFANAALRWLCRGAAGAPVRIVAVSR
jgi:hypothetical protein